MIRYMYKKPNIINPDLKNTSENYQEIRRNGINTERSSVMNKKGSYAQFADKESEVLYDWVNGEYPEVEDIRQWISVMKDSQKASKFLPLPDAMWEFYIYVSGILSDQETVTESIFIRNYGSDRLWEVIKKKWLEYLDRHVSLRRALEINFKSAKKSNQVQDVIVSHPKKDIIPQKPVNTISTTFKDTNFSKFLQEIKIKPLPGEYDTVQMGTGTTCGILGRGGWGTVYKTFNDQLEIYRAVKLLQFHNNCETEHEYRKLERRSAMEAKIWANLNHGNIVQVHGYGDWEGLPYIEMELVHGSDLKKIIKNKGQLPLEVVTSISLLVTRALRFAHRQKVQLFGENYEQMIHRDIKPSNILCSDKGFIKIADFGLAKPVHITTDTVTNTFMGSAQYASPEQLKSIHQDERTDIYSLGVTMYEMLAGVEMFPQKSVLAIFSARECNKFVPVKKIRRRIPGNLVKVVNRCIHENADERFQNTTELYDALEDCHKKITSESPDIIMEDYVYGKKWLLNNSKTEIVRKKFWFF
ncbi:MAG: serine/threonine protein kinase [Fibrobacter sp.]|mgnify:FL=1|nr:serine/threonine protein kinase [Fibrobacter sp.]